MITFSQSVSVAKTTQDWGACVLRGIGCNFLGESTPSFTPPSAQRSAALLTAPLVCMAVFLAGFARDIVSKCVVLHFPIMTFVFLGFEHVIVNMYYIPIGIINGADVGVGTYIGRSMIPSLIGNIIGGMLLGIPMMLMHQPIELPMFNKRQRTESVVVRQDGVSSEAGTVTPPSGEKK